MEKNIEQKIRENIRIGLEVIKNSNMMLLKNGYKITWDKSGKFKIERERTIEKTWFNLVDIEKAIDIIYKGGKK
jgi:hypothetical protein